MTITVQARAPGGTWETRTAFVTENQMLSIHQISARDLIDRAQRFASLWRVYYRDGCEVRVFNSEDHPKTGGMQ
jgi:hypothetical protein